MPLFLDVSLLDPQKRYIMILDKKKFSSAGYSATQGLSKRQTAAKSHQTVDLSKKVDTNIPQKAHFLEVGKFSPQILPRPLSLLELPPESRVLFHEVGLPVLDFLEFFCASEALLYGLFCRNFLKMRIALQNERGKSNNNF